MPTSSKKQENPYVKAIAELRRGLFTDSRNKGVNSDIWRCSRWNSYIQKRKEKVDAPELLAELSAILNGRFPTTWRRSEPLCEMEMAFLNNEIRKFREKLPESTKSVHEHLGNQDLVLNQIHHVLCGPKENTAKRARLAYESEIRRMTCEELLAHKKKLHAAKLIPFVEKYTSFLGKNLKDSMIKYFKANRKVNTISNYFVSSSLPRALPCVPQTIEANECKGTTTTNAMIAPIDILAAQCDDTPICPIPVETKTNKFCYDTIIPSIGAISIICADSQTGEKTNTKYGTTPGYDEEDDDFGLPPCPVHLF